MRLLQPWLFAISLCLLTGCAATRSRDPLAARQKAYERLASFLEPGMTRRQVYALLPPARTPTYRGSEPLALSMGYSLPGPFGYCEEKHPLDADFELRVSYLLAHSAMPVIKTKPWPRTSKVCITAKDIDRLLFGDPLTVKTHRSKQDMDDQLFFRPQVARKQIPLQSAPESSVISALR